MGIGDYLKFRMSSENGFIGKVISIDKREDGSYCGVIFFGNDKPTVIKVDDHINPARNPCFDLRKSYSIKGSKYRIEGITYKIQWGEMQYMYQLLNRKRGYIAAMENNINTIGE
jgi:hypothetical protein